MDLKAGRYTERGLYGGSKVTLDNDVKEVKPTVPKVDVSENILMDTKGALSAV